MLNHAILSIMKFDVILAGITFNANLMAKIIAALD